MWTDAGLPFNGSSPLSRHTSRAGAEDAKARSASQIVRYLSALKEHGGLTDLEASKLLNIDRTSVNARRATLVKAGLVVASGETRPGPTGVKNCVWRLA